MSQNRGMNNWPVGTHLSCKTTTGAAIKGNVVASDQKFGALVIREGNSSGAVHVINLRCVTDLEILPSSSSDIRPPLSRLPVNLQKVRKRLEGSMETRRSQVQAVGVNVSPQAQQIFNHIRKIYSDTRWDGQVIVVLGETRVSPPYTPSDVTGGSAKSRIQKVLTKYSSSSNGD